MEVQGHFKKTGFGYTHNLFNGISNYTNNQEKPFFDGDTRIFPCFIWYPILIPKVRSYVSTKRRQKGISTGQRNHYKSGESQFFTNLIFFF